VTQKTGPRRRLGGDWKEGGRGSSLLSVLGSVVSKRKKEEEGTVRAGSWRGDMGQLTDKGPAKTKKKPRQVHRKKKERNVMT